MLPTFSIDTLNKDDNNCRRHNFQFKKSLEHVLKFIENAQILKNLHYKIYLIFSKNVWERGKITIIWI